MSILCKLLGHKWEGCVCRRCEAARHTWNVDGVCTTCEAQCQHDWLRCKCKICGFVQPIRDPSHAWSDGVCDECGTTCQHDWLTCKCAICDAIKPLHDLAHSWDEGICQECSMECPHEWQSDVCSARHIIRHPASHRRWRVCGLGKPRRSPLPGPPLADPRPRGHGFRRRSGFAAIAVASLPLDRAWLVGVR